MYDPRLDNLAEVLVNYSTSVEKGDLVLLTAPPLGKSFLVALYQAVLRAGAHPHVRMPPDECAAVMLRTASGAQLRYVDPIERFAADRIDAAICVCPAQSPKGLEGIDPAKQVIAEAARKKALTRLDKRVASGKLRRVRVWFPTQAAAREAKMSLPAYEQLVFDAGLLYTDSPASAWREVSRRQQSAVEYLGEIGQLRFTAPGDTDLKVSVAGRKWVSNDGREDFPDGEIFTSPLENSAEGTVRFSFPAMCEGHVVEGIRLTFKKGRVVKASADEGEKFLRKMLDQDAGARVLGEIAFGTNYSVRRHIGNAHFDRKIGGTFHVTLGQARPKTGGKNKSEARLDMVCDLRHRGRVLADDELIMEDGRFVRPSWPKM